jgi:hypothetical protein
MQRSETSTKTLRECVFHFGALETLQQLPITKPTFVRLAMFKISLLSRPKPLQEYDMPKWFCTAYPGDGEYKWGLVGTQLP